MNVPLARTRIGVRTVEASWSPAQALVLLACAVAVAVVAGFSSIAVESSAGAVAQAGGELTRLLRFMALLKAMMAAAATAAVVWRLCTPVGSVWLAAYLMACASMAAGPGLIWSMTHVGAGALLLHAGLAVTILLLWRDPAVGLRLAAMVRARRARIGAA